MWPSRRAGSKVVAAPGRGRAARAGERYGWKWRAEREKRASGACVGGLAGPILMRAAFGRQGRAEQRLCALAPRPPPRLLERRAPLGVIPVPRPCPNVPRARPCARTGKGKQCVTSSVLPTSNPSSCPVTSAGMLSLQCCTILSATRPSICTAVVATSSSAFVRLVAAAYDMVYARRCSALAPAAPPPGRPRRRAPRRAGPRVYRSPKRRRAHGGGPGHCAGAHGARAAVMQASRRHPAARPTSRLVKRTCSLLSASKSRVRSVRRLKSACRSLVGGVPHLVGGPDHSQVSA